MNPGNEKHLSLQKKMSLKQILLDPSTQHDIIEIKKNHSQIFRPRTILTIYICNIQYKRDKSLDARPDTSVPMFIVARGS